ncbi:DNA repair protein RAD51 homolog 4 isoform X1 [Nasonia vitripennis]|uniref:RecA family profile 1 domain-containing protein n=1 Tax=Nasonia vitripennis TaxID=7425 RepID=A0A7M7TBY5_NASVI|nr:DNA repair protein RAD51 homolog 4 isoform X1 [Nasonia vitripennis]XP_032452298.1 DNA repair protein RAD51 homolog 4 isoform X1 [Nasonia vitripennis]XP_032452299.1 DNA repair protein RAD51 homolog 4 isoform X1 [Nasonia vitripennis]XP_032452300.1 DNA repair protein RAD51 homolog 4 isoform X1 [Nasonia vitripennis]
MARLDSKTFPALTEDVIAKLQSRNIFTVYDFMILQTCDDLMRRTGMSFKEIESIRESIFKSFGGEIIGNPADLGEREIQDVIPTGTNNLDALLKGGLHCHKIYEFCGFSSSGKSQLCHWISMCATLNASTEVHYVDASKNFCASRIQMMLEAKQCTDTILGEVMSGIRVYQIHKIHELFTVLHCLSNLPKSDSSKKLVIVDSLSALCAIVPNTGLTPILSNLASVCRFLVNNSRVAVVIVNTF